MRHRTALITAGAIGAVVFAGAIAVGANLGILTVTDSGPVGQLSAATVIPTTASAAPEVSPTSVPAKKASSSQAYIIKKAGTVKVAFSKSGVRLVDVSAKRHWTWALAQTGDNKLTVTFKHGSDTYTFVASMGAHGKLMAKVDHPVTRVVPAASSGGSGTWAAANPAPVTQRPTRVASNSGHGEGDSHGGSHNGGGADD